MKLNSTNSRPTDTLFLAFLALFAFLPLPRGGTLDWAWMSMCIYVFILMTAWLALYIKGKTEVTEAFRAAQIVIVALVTYLAWNIIQMVPLPMGWLEKISPLSAQIYNSGMERIQFAPISVDTNATREELFKGTAYLVIFVLSLLLIDSRRRMRILGKWLIGLAVLQAVLASMMAVYGKTIYYDVIPYSAQGTFANRNQLAGYLVLNLSIGIGMLLGLMNTEVSKNWREFLRNLATSILSSKARLRIYLAIIVIALIMTHSRMGNFAFFSSLLLAGVIALVLMQNSPRGLVILISSLIVIDIFILGTLVGLEVLEKRYNKLQTQTISLSEGSKTVDRVVLTNQALMIHKNSRMAGTGAGTFNSVFPQYQKYPGYWQHAHNDYAEFLTDTGVIGISILGFIAILPLYYGCRAMRKRRSNQMRGLAFSAVMGTIAILIFSSTDFNLRVPANVVMLILIIAFSFISLRLDSHNLSRVR